MNAVKKDKQKRQPTKVELILETAHTHAGIEYGKGDSITVNLSQADRLEENRIGFRKKAKKVSGSDDDNSGKAPDDI